MLTLIEGPWDPGVGTDDDLVVRHSLGNNSENRMLLQAAAAALAASAHSFPLQPCSSSCSGFSRSRLSVIISYRTNYISMECICMIETKTERERTY